MKKGSMFIMGALALSVFACSDDAESPNSNVSMIAKASLGSGASSAGSREESVVLDAFKINIREIEFEYDMEIETENDAEEEALERMYEDVKLKGPFEIDLLSAEGAALDQLITSTSIPNGNFEEIEFKLHKNENPQDAMYGRSVYASGTINGTPFVFWHNTDEEFEIDFEDVNRDIQLTGRSLQLIINFNLGRLFNPAMGVDVSRAIDRNENGIIEIDPNDTDGNGWLADLLKDELEDATDLVDDQEEQKD